MIKKETIALAEGSALAVGKNEEEKKKRWCDFCNKPGHILDKCWKLHGKLTNFSK